MDDIITYSILAASVFLAVVAFGLLTRYRQASKTISQSTDLGKDLWKALESRMRKQDERILDVMARLEVIQARVLTTAVPMAVPAAAPPAEMKPSGPTKVMQEAPRQMEESEHPAGEPQAAQLEEKEPEPEAASQEPSRQEEATSQPVLTPETTLDSRLARQDQLLSDILGRLDAISQKVAERPPALTAQPSQAPRTYAEQQGRATNEKVSEKELLALLNTRPLRSVELIEAFAITREHAARLLKDLFDRGLVVRNAEHKPFVYELTEEGKKAVSGS